MTTKNFGEITLSNKVIITDPCYELWTWCQWTLENILPWKWNVSIVYEEDRVSRQIYKHIDYLNDSSKLEETKFDIWVDSWQAGIFDTSIFPKEKEWANVKKFYDLCCETTLWKWYHYHQEVWQLKRDIQNLKESWNNQKEIQIKEAKLKELEKNPIPYYQWWIIYDKWFVSSTAYWDWSYNLYIKKNKDNKVIWMELKL